MKSAIFIIFSDNPVSIRRFLLVAKDLTGLNIKSIFLDCTNELQTKINFYAGSLNINYTPDYIKYGNENLQIVFLVKKVFSRILSKLNKVFNRKRNIFNNLYAHRQYPENNKLGKLLNKLHIDNCALIKGRLSAYYISFWSNVSISESILDGTQPDCVIFDIGLPLRTRAFLFAAHKRNIPIVQMEHGEGFGKQYSNLPLFADYYIAYSTYNYDILKIMGVNDEAIFLTGVPDTDILYNFNNAQIKKELNEKYDISFNKKIVLLALKPNKEGYSQLNLDLLEACYNILGNNNDIVILLKIHPVDLLAKNSGFKQKTSAKPRNVIIVNAEFPISKLLSVSDYFITYMSSAIVEAVLLKAPTIVIETDDMAVWPDWNRFNVYHSTKPENLNGVLTQIKEDTYKAKYMCSEVSRKEFIRYFRYKYDSNASKRIGDAVKELIS